MTKSFVEINTALNRGGAFGKDPKTKNNVKNIKNPGPGAYDYNYNP